MADSTRQEARIAVQEGVAAFDTKTGFMSGPRLSGTCEMAYGDLAF